MTSTPLTQRLKPLAQRRRDMAEEIAILQGQLRIAQGIKVLHVASCGHSDCGDPPPQQLPPDAWVVHLGCKHLTPKEVTPEAIAEQVQVAASTSPQQEQVIEALLELGPLPTIRSVSINR